MKLVVLTEARYEKPVKRTPYIENILLEDALVCEALSQKGFQVSRRNWADDRIDWSSVDYAVFRSTWDYFDRFREFGTWLDAVCKYTRLVNPCPMIRWNMDKHYLLELEAKGVQIPRTIPLKKNCGADLPGILNENKLNEAILKPMISGAARHTFRISGFNAEDHNSLFREYNREEDFMLQEFQRSILDLGEASLMIFGGNYSHAILKKAREGDFRVQDDFGGSVHSYQPTAVEIEFAEKITHLCDPLPAYSRVDFTWDDEHNPVLIELELIEPELWFRFRPEAADLFAAAVARHVGL